MQIHDFRKMKEAGQSIKMVTCYDYWTAKILSHTNIDCVLVGDSAAMVMHGADSTIAANCEMMATHIKAVKLGIGEKFIVGDMPFLSYRKSKKDTMKAVEKLMKAGAQAIKLEGVIGNETLISHIINSGVPVMGHVGFTPQSVNIFGDLVVQGRAEKDAEFIKSSAKFLENLGCFAVVLECIPANLAEKITENLSIPTIGIGAGNKTSGQVLVLQDLIGSNEEFNPKFLKKYLNVHDLIKNAVNQYCDEVDSSLFPDPIKHSYGVLKK